MRTLMSIEGVGEKYGEKLKKAGVKNTTDFLDKGATRKGRDDLAKESKISGKLILKWINMVDLSRVKGIGEEYSDLLEASGVDSVPELSKRRADNLYETMLKTNQKKKLVRKPPTEKQVEQWIKQAKALPKIVKH